MTKLTREFMQSELDYLPIAEHEDILYNDYYNKICNYVFMNNAFRLTPNAIEFWIENGYCENAPYYKCIIDTKEGRENYFKRAMGLQLIYDAENGRNTMVKGTDGNDDINREAQEYLNALGLIQKIRW